jgi:hypothetical protein
MNWKIRADTTRKGKKMKITIEKVNDLMAVEIDGEPVDSGGRQLHPYSKVYENVTHLEMDEALIEMKGDPMVIAALINEGYMQWLNPSSYDNYALTSKGLTCRSKINPHNANMKERLDKALQKCDAQKLELAVQQRTIKDRDWRLEEMREQDRTAWAKEVGSLTERLADHTTLQVTLAESKAQLVGLRKRNVDLEANLDRLRGNGFLKLGEQFADEKRKLADRDKAYAKLLCDYKKSEHQLDAMRNNWEDLEGELREEREKCAQMCEKLQREQANTNRLAGELAEEQARNKDWSALKQDYDRLARDYGGRCKELEEQKDLHASNRLVREDQLRKARALSGRLAKRVGMLNEEGVVMYKENECLRHGLVENRKKLRKALLYVGNHRSGIFPTNVTSSTLLFNYSHWVELCTSAGIEIKNGVFPNCVCDGCRGK